MVSICFTINQQKGCPEKPHSHMSTEGRARAFCACRALRAASGGELDEGRVPRALLRRGWRANASKAQICQLDLVFGVAQKERPFGNKCFRLLEVYFHLLKTTAYFSLLVLKGIYHYWIDCVSIFQGT